MYRNAFILAPIVELPFGPGKPWLNNGVGGVILGGWRVSAIYTISAGTPFGITDNSYGFCNGAGVLEDRPMLIGNPGSISGSRRSPNLWFNNQAFDFAGTCPGSGLVNSTGSGEVTKAFGDAPRFFSGVSNPGVDNLDFSLQKDFKIPVGEQTRIVFSADFFNLPNHAQFAEPNGDPTTGYHPADPSAGQRGTGFGTIGSTSSLPNRLYPARPAPLLLSPEEPLAKVAPLPQPYWRLVKTAGGPGQFRPVNVCCHPQGHLQVPML